MSRLVKNDPLVEQAYQEYLRFTANPKMREKARERQRFLEDHKIITDAAKTEGRTEREIEIAKNMKNKGLAVELIAELTGLSPKEIERLN